jgi:type IV secretion system protein VirD4
VGHILVVAGTQSGKTVSIVLPTLLDEEPGRARSMIIHDPKESLYPKSARYRSKLGKVVRLAPLCPETDFLNPWDPVRLGTDDEFRDVELIATYLTNPEGKASRDDVTEHFQELLNQFFCGVFLYGLHTGIATTGREFNDLVNCTAWKDLLTVMAAHDHPEVQRAAMIASRPGDKELGALQTTAARALRIFSDPRIAHMTSTSSFRMEELREADQPCTVYLSVPFGDQQRLRPLTRLLLRQMLDHCTSKLSGWKHPLLAMIEEFPSLGRFEPISDGLNFAAEFGLQYCLITPSMEELINTYGAHHNFLAGCRVQAIFGLSDEGTARKFSGRVGTRERKQQRITTQKGGRQSSTEDVREEPLLNTTGVLQLEEHEVLIMAGRYQRIVSQARYYTSALWNPRSVLPIPPSSVVTTTKPK